MNQLDKANGFDAARRRFNERIKNNLSNVYQDEKNAHNEQIRSDALKIGECLITKFGGYNSAVMKKLKEKICYTRVESKRWFRKPKENITENKPYLEVLEFIESNTAIFDGKYTISDIACAVFLFIETFNAADYPSMYDEKADNKEIKNELMKRFVQELMESQDLCSTGHYTRIANVIQGFTDDENLRLGITDYDRATEIISAALDKSLQECNDNTILDGLVEPNDELAMFLNKNIKKEWVDEFGGAVVSNIVKKRYNVLC